VLYAAEGLSNVQIAGRLEMCSKVVGQWRRRFCEQRLDGLHDQPRSGGTFLRAHDQHQR
jgi:transposase